MTNPTAEQGIRDRLRHVLETAGSEWDGRPFCRDALVEIERLEHIQRDFHNVDDVAEIKRLREVIESIREALIVPATYRDAYHAALVVVERARSAADVT